MDNFYQKCKENNLKITPQRIAIYKALKDSIEHPSAERVRKMIQENFPNISLDTVNRTLLTFSDIQLIDVVEGNGDPRRFEPNLEEHHHFYCMGCNEIFDIFDSEPIHVSLPESIEQSFTITGKRLCLKGFCSRCRQKES